MLNNVLRLRSYSSSSAPGFVSVVLQNLSTNFAATNSNKEFRCYCSKSSEQSERGSQQQRKGTSLPALRNPFDDLSDKSKKTFVDMVKIFQGRDIRRRNHVEFIYAALKSMAEFGVERDLEVYKALVNVMPKGKFIPTNVFQVEFMHYPKQQQCIIDLLEQMEDNAVIPDTEMETMLLNIFGKRGHPLRKFWRMMYWMPKFKNLSPWPLPIPMPDETLEIAKLAVERMCSVDLCSRITVYNTKLVEDAVDDTWIVSGMSPEQSQLLLEHPTNKPLYIEGPYLIWLRDHSLNYFILRADPDEEVLKSFPQPGPDDDDDVSQLRVPCFGKPVLRNRYGVLGKVRSVHQQNDGTIFSICVTGTSTKDSLLSWIRLLEADNNSSLGSVPVVFRLKSVIKEKAIPIEAKNALSADTKEVDREQSSSAPKG